MNFGEGGYATSDDLFVFYHGNLSYELIYQDNGVDNQGEDVRHYASLLEGHIGVRVHISTNTQFPMIVKVNGVTVASGNTNTQYRIYLV